MDDLRRRDSTFSDASSSLADLPDIFDGIEENGRRYWINREAKYRYPLSSDEREEVRLRVQHQLCFQAMKYQLILAPIHPNLQRVLDVGTGLGSWASEFAINYPPAVVIGIDLVPIQLDSIPPNCEFQIYDAETPWNFTYPFNLVHLRYADTWVRDWPNMTRQTFEALEPGGWIELKSDLPCEYNESTAHHTAISKYYQDLASGSRAMGIRLYQDGRFYQQLLKDAGFINFQEKKFYLDSTKMRKLYCQEGLDTFGKGYIGRGLEMGLAELEVQLATVRDALQDPTLDVQFPFITCCAQKPSEE